MGADGCLGGLSYDSDALRRRMEVVGIVARACERVLVFGCCSEGLCWLTFGS